MITAISQPILDSELPSERLTGEVVFDALGEPAQPSSALPFDPAVRIPTMLEIRELNYLHWLASTLQGDGRVVELGCFLGGSTSALAAGKMLHTLSPQPILTYDAFEIPSDTHPRGVNNMAFFGLNPGQNFRSQFDEYTKDHHNAIDVRQGWLISNANESQERSLYPEQHPIELLFVDIAKTWDTHLTVLRTFARHLCPGATLVQQDFFDLQLPWIPLHMFQLREAFEPLDAIHGTSSLSFRCCKDPSAILANLWTESDFTDRDIRRQIWNDVREYWKTFLGPEAIGFLHGHESMHALTVADAEESVRCGRLYEAWSRSVSSKNVYFTYDWPHFVSTLPDELDSLGTPSKSAAIFAAECSARGSRSNQPFTKNRISFSPIEQRHQVWDTVLSTLAKEGHKRIALFGAGKHTRWLLNNFMLADKIEVACIIDDDPAQEPIPGIALLASSDAAEHLQGYLKDVTAILPSSDIFEPQLFDRLQELFADNEAFELFRVYTDPAVGNQDKPKWLFTLQIPDSPPSPSAALDHQAVDLSPAHRSELGLSERRTWITPFVERYALPSWVIHHVFHIGHPEAAFLWDLIEAICPANIVEIGTASGVSTAMLLAGADQFCSDDTIVYSYDVATECFFDKRHSIASAIGQMAPDLLHRARLHVNANAVDAASCFKVAEIDFVFIDAEHSHPSPAIDLLSLLYALKPNAWVALHDVELSKLPRSWQDTGQGANKWEIETGAERLFNAWPFKKVQLAGQTPSERNIGAIEIPSNPADAIPCLVSLLKGPWEMHTPLRPAIEKALQKLEGLKT